MAVILTTTLLGLITFQTAGPGAALFGLATGLLLGVGVGWAVGVVGALAIDRVRLGASGLYPVLALAFGLSAYGLAELVTGNGFLAVYVCGLLIGNRVTAGRTVIIQSNDALAWLAQIAMFLTMGLLVFPSDLIDVAPVGIAVAAVLMFVARPASAFLCLAPFGFDRKEMGYVSWAGLKGAVPIVLATFPATVGVAAASELFSVVFFVVVASVLLQGWTQIPVARRLGVLNKRGGTSGISPSAATD